MSERQIPALDDLRGFAVLVVFVGHAANDGMLPEWLGGGSGQMGVQLFFLLSGYLMMHCYGMSPPSRAAFWEFLAARAGRILPLYWLVLGLSAVAAWAGLSPHYAIGESEVLARAAGFLTAPQELWSIPVEVQFYALFLLLWAGLARWPLPVIAGLVAVSFLVAGMWRGWISDAMVLLPFLPVFLIGCWIGRLHAADRLPAYLGNRALLLTGLVFFALNLPGLRLLWLDEIWSGFYPRFWLDPLRLGAAILLLTTAVSFRAALFPNLGLARLGQISFCVYLIHRPILRYARDGLGLEAGPFAALLCFVVCCAIAALSLRILERPAARMIRRLARPQQPPVRLQETG